MKRIPKNKWFQLPRLGKDAFSSLMRARVRYDSKFGFQITSTTDTARALSILSDAIGEDIELETLCFICERPLEEDLSPDAVLCKECLQDEDAYSLYTMRFQKMIENV